MTSTRKICLAAFAVLLFPLVALSLIPARIYEDYISAKITSAAAERGLRVNLNGLKLKLLGVAADRGEVFLPATLTLLPFERVSTSLSFWSLLLGTLHITANGSFLDGDLAFSGDRQDWSVRGQAINVSKYPGLETFGFTAGKLASAEVSNKAGTVQFNLLLNGIEHPTLTVGQIPGSSTPIIIPEFHNGSVSAVGTQSEQRVTLSAVSVSSDLGKIDSSSVELSLARNGSVRGNLRLELSPRGATTFGALIDSYLSNHGSSAPQQAAEGSKYDISLSGPLRNPQWTLAPAPAM